MNNLRRKETEMPTKPIPNGYHTLTPYITVRGVSKVIEFLKEAFAAEEINRFTLPDGTIKNVELRVGDSMVMMAEANDHFGPRPTTLYMYVKNTDEAYQRALKAGAKSLMEPQDMFYGDRNGGVEDAGGNIWWIATHKEDVSQEEIVKRFQEMKEPH
jgi:PhnB protein